MFACALCLVTCISLLHEAPVTGLLAGDCLKPRHNRQRCLLGRGGSGGREGAGGVGGGGGAGRELN